MRAPVTALVLSLLPLSAPFRLAGQTAAASGSFTEAVEVSVVNVDVYVTDRGGAPISGLTQEDFALFDSGQPVPISYFEAVAAGWSKDRPPGPEDQPAREPLQLVVMMDNVNTRLENRGRVIDQLKTALAKRLLPEDRVMVASYERVVTVQQSFTNDQAVIFAALDRLETSPNYGVELDTEMDMMGDFLDYALEGEMGRCHHVLEGIVSRYSGAVTHRISSMVEVVKVFLGTLAQVPGKKSMLYVSDGLELRPGSAVVRRLGGFCGDSAASIRAEGIDLAVTLQRLSSAANSARVTLYPYDAFGGKQAARRSRRGDSSQFEGRDSLQDSLSFLAADTGGRAMLNANDLESVIHPLWEDTGGYYSLGYEAPQRAGGELHRLEVKVRRKGASARYRHGYTDLSEDERLAALLMGALWLGQADNPQELTMEPGGGARAAEGGYRVPLRIAVPLSKLTLSEEGSTYAGGFSVFVTAVDESGHRAPLARSEVPVVIPTAELEGARQQHFGYEIGMILGDGKHRVAIGIRDQHSKVVSIITHEIEVQPEVSGTAGAL